MRDEIRRLALFGSGVVELTRHRAEQIVKELVKAGDIRRQEASGTVRELLTNSRENRKELTRFLRTELTNQIASLGLASKRDVERLERRVARLESSAKVARSTTKKKTTSTSTAKKSTGRTSRAPRQATTPPVPGPGEGV